MGDEKALNQYLKKAGEAEALIEEIQEAIDAHHGVMPDEINWTHVGDMSRVASELREIRNFLASTNKVTQ